MPEIILPRNVFKEPKRQVLACLTCGTEFETDQVGKFERHVARCAERNDTEIEAQLDSASISRKLPSMFGPEAGDVEFERWMKENRDAVLEGRLKP